MGQFTPFDLIVLLLLSNSVQNAMTGPDTTLQGGMMSAATLITLNYLTSVLSAHFKPFRKIVEGVPVVLVERGQLNEENIKKVGITIDEVEEALRQHEVSKIEDVDLAVMEIDGSVSVIRLDPSAPDHVRVTRRHHWRHLGRK